MILNLLLNIGKGAIAGFIIGIILQQTGGTCPLTCNPYRATITGAIIGIILGLTNAIRR